MIGLATTRELTRADVRFSGSGMQTVEVAVPLSDAARNWYRSVTSRVFGSHFSLALPFTAQGDSRGVQSATVVLVSAVGASTAVSVEMR